MRGAALDPHGLEFRNVVEDFLPLPLDLSISQPLGSRLGRVPVQPRTHAARAKFSTNNPRANSLSSNGSNPYLSAAVVVAVCEDGRPLASFGATAPLGCCFFPSAETGLSTLERKIAVDTLVSPLLLALFLRYQAARLIPISLHGWVVDRELATYSARGRMPLMRRLSARALRARTLRSSSRARLLTLTLPIVVRPSRCRCS